MENSTTVDLKHLLEQKLKELRDTPVEAAGSETSLKNADWKLLLKQKLKELQDFDERIEKEKEQYEK